MIVPPVEGSWPGHHHIPWPLDHLVNGDRHGLLDLHRVNKKILVSMVLIAKLVLLWE